MVQLGTALAAKGLDVSTLYDQKSSTATLGSIESTITKCDVVIADITDSNPNVMYEVGFSRGARKPVLLIREVQAKEAQSEYPSDLAGVFVLNYNVDNLDSIADDLVYLIERVYATEIA
jgi:nucleoside 2-deoxyribosyltransferase